MSMSAQIVGTAGFLREILMTEGFFEHLRRARRAAERDRNPPDARFCDGSRSLYLARLSAAADQFRSARRRSAGSNSPVHFGNDGKNIRKFRQTVRDAWERHVSAVYPEARAEFDTTAIRLHVSPPPLTAEASSWRPSDPGRR